MPRGLTVCLRSIGRLGYVTVIILILCIPIAAQVSERGGDAYLTGYIASILDHDLHWERNSYRFKVVNGVLKITLFEEDTLRREEADKQLRAIDGLRGIVITVKPVDSSRPGLAYRVLGLTGQGEGYPTGDFFRPLLADPKQPQFFVSAKRFKSMGVQYTMAAVGFGETFGLYRFLGSREGNGMQISLEGAIFAQFNLNTPSSDLVNADYTIGIPLTYRRGDYSLRWRIYHQSSHLGDELLLSANHPTRLNLSYEATELILSREWRQWRVYVGGEYLVHKEPADLKPASAHWGVEYSGSQPVLWNGRFVAGLDMKKMEEHNWTIDTSVKAGLEFGHPNPGQRRLRVMAEWYKGLDPHGQFYNNSINYFGIGVSLGF